MADSISTLKGSLKPGVIERPALQIYKTISDYFERSLKERLNDYDSANTRHVPDDYPDNSLNNQAVSHSMNNYNPVEYREYSTTYSQKNDNYKEEQKPNNGSGSEVRTDEVAARSNSDNTASKKNEALKNNGKEAEKPAEVTANNNQKNKSEQVENKAENKAETNQNVKNSQKNTGKSEVSAAELQLIKNGKIDGTTLKIVKNPDEISVKKNVKLHDNVKATADASILKLSETPVKSEFANIKINPGFVAKTAEIMQEVKQGDKTIKVNEQAILNNKEISGLFIKQNEVVSKNQSTNNIDNLTPGLTKIEQAKIGEKINTKVNNSENNLLPKDDKAQQTAAKYITDNNTQASQNISKEGIAERVYNSPKIAGKEFDFTNSVGLRRVKLEEIADKTLQLAKNIQSNATQTARLYLKPPSLGTVFVEITMKDNIAKILMKADTREVMKNLENQLISLQEKLNQQGIKTESIKIEVRQVENDITDRHAFFEGSNARHKDGKANREFIGTLNQISREEELVAADEFDEDGLLINTNYL